MRHPIYSHTHSSPKQHFFESLQRVMVDLCGIILVFPMYFAGCGQGGFRPSLVLIPHESLWIFPSCCSISQLVFLERGLWIFGLTLLSFNSSLEGTLSIGGSFCSSPISSLSYRFGSWSNDLFSTFFCFQGSSLVFVLGIP
jgi:hypothetical protein